MRRAGEVSSAFASGATPSSAALLVAIAVIASYSGEVHFRDDHAGKVAKSILLAKARVSSHSHRFVIPRGVHECSKI